MPSLTTFGVFAVAAMALLVVPGPSVMFIVARSIDHGRLAGFVSVLGVHAGSLVHITAAAVGLSALLVQSAIAFTAEKIVGAAYLVALGARRLLRPSREVAEVERTPPDLWRLFRQGFVVNTLNPKTAAFFLALLPQFVDPSRNVVTQVLALGLTFIVLGICSDSAYALAAGAVGRRLKGRRTERVTGAVYVGLGVTVALTGRPNA